MRRISSLFGSLVRRWRRTTPDPVGAPEAAQLDRDLVLRLSPSRIPNTAQLRHLPRVLGPKEASLVRTFTTLACLSFLFLAGHWLQRHVGTAPYAGGTLTEGIIGTPQYINPVLARPNSADQDLTNLVFRGLMKVNTDQSIGTDLAESLQASDDAKTYTLKLRQNLRWSDGESITADDVLFTFETISESAYKSPYFNTFQSVKVESSDSRTIKFTLTQPQAAFPSFLTIGILPSHIWANGTPQNFPLDEYNLRPIGNGPYMFDSFARDTTGTIHSHTFVRNPFYSGPAALIDKIVIKYYDDSAAAIDALSKGSVDSLGGIPIEERSSVARRRPVAKIPTWQLTSIFFNQKTNPALKVKEVRQALALTVNRKELIERDLDGAGVIATGPFVPGQLGYAADIHVPSQDNAKANDILEAAGWKKNDNGIRQKGPQLITFVLTVPDEPAFVAMAQRLIKNWQSIGAQVELKRIGSDRMVKEIIKPRQYEALMFGQIFDNDPDPYPFWHSSQQRETGFALALFFNKGLDTALENARKTTKAEDRIKEYRTFQQIVIDEVPAIPLFQSVYLYAHPKSLRPLDHEMFITATDRFRHMAQWYIKTRLTWH